MKKRSDKKQLYIALIFILALAIGMGYAFLNTTLNITGNATIKENSWDVHFENFTPTTGSVTATSAGIDTNRTAVNYTVTLQKPGDFYEFTVDVVNKGSIDAMISTFSNTGLSAAQAKYMTYSVTYSDGVEVAQYQKLDATAGSETIKVKVEYKKDISASDLPSTNQQVTLTFSVQYVQADGSAVAISHPLCIRATTLHKPSDSSTETYGNLGSGNTINAGDAFDCDVNGDGTFNAETERFYYISPLDTNSNSAVLIYHSNVSGGIPNSTATYSYDSAYNVGSGSNFSPQGPNIAKFQLPTTAQWKNVSLSSTTRNIKDETGAVIASNFSYEGYAARILTYQEVVSACGAGTPTSSRYLDNCKYLIENSGTSSKYGYWLEDSHWINGSMFWGGSVPYLVNVCRYNDASPYSYQLGVRPAIEVPLSKIQK